jgi:hypothetical protein
MFTMNDLRAAYLRVVERHDLWYTVAGLLRRDLKRGVGYEFHSLNGRFVKCWDEITQCELCLGTFNRKLTVQDSDMVDRANAYLKLKASQDEVGDILYEPISRDFDYEYVSEYLFRDYSESIARVTRVYNTILTLQGKPTVAALDLRQMADLKQLYTSAFDTRKIPLSDVVDIQCNKTSWLVCNGRFIDQKIFVIKPHAPVNKFILQLFVDLKQCIGCVPQLTAEQVAKLPVELENEPIETFMYRFIIKLKNPQ